MKKVLKAIIALCIMLICFIPLAQNPKVCSDFSPEPGKDYVLMAWVHEDHPTPVTDFTGTEVSLKFYNSTETLISGTNISFFATGDIIDGWQKVYGEFNIPELTASVSIEIINNSSVASYLDDLRVFPFNGSLKSFIYDVENRRLKAELDENNYATFYEYDNEGGLVRVKKETEKGIYTIQESRSSTEKSSEQ